MIVAVAIQHRGKTYSLPRPNRHHHVILHIVSTTGASHVDGEQGFLDDEGNFLSRAMAAGHAFACGQIKEEKKGLFSEDVW
ncbi:MAG TPA: hypothetical protein VFA98_16625 [Thermoanaerobaculia bacterium]|jgi:hypothetical protein|nr:hypothetical protein [Thermoanaerobaculia bacterium]